MAQTRLIEPFRPAPGAKRPAQRAPGRGILLFTLKRLGAALVQWVIAVTGVFILLRLLPANPALQFMGTPDAASPAAIAAEERILGLDTPLPAQILSFLGHSVRGDFGVSWETRTPVFQEIANALPVTIQLIVLAFAVSLVISIPIGVAAAIRPGGRLDRVVRTYSLFAGSQPEFFWGLLFIYVGWFVLKIFPAPLGQISISVTPPPVVTHFIFIDTLLAGDLETFGNAAAHYILPVVTMAFALSGPFVKQVRENALSVSNSEFMLYARAIGLPQRTLWAYVLRNSLAPILTLVGLFFAAALGGSAIIESVFSLPGVGVYTLQRTLGVDFPAVQGAVVLMTGFSLLVYVAMDILYAVIDPRVRYGQRAG